MPWVEFTSAYDWYPRKRDRRHHLAFKPGHVLNVTRPCAAEVKAAGVARGTRVGSADEARAIAANGNRRPESA